MPARSETSPPLLDREQVYLVESDDDPTVLLAVAPRLTPRRVGWHDTVRYRSFPVLGSRRLASGAVELRTPHATYRLRPLTRELYETHVRRRVTGSPRFPSDEALRRHYLSLPR